MKLNDKEIAELANSQIIPLENPDTYAFTNAQINVVQKVVWIAGFKKCQSMSEWVDCKVRLPETACQVLGIMKDTLDIYVCHYKLSRKLFLVYGAGTDPISDMKVTHWMSLPNPPIK